MGGVRQIRYRQWLCRSGLDFGGGKAGGIGVNLSA
ncbi:hypothetical protein ES703_92423 [subsurface metagenome]